MDKVICITGPTASGKTSLSIELAKRLNGEIISADSMQIYKGLDIGSAKVTEEEKENIPHHLIDIVDSDVNFSVADFKKLCTEKIEDIIKRKKVPIIVGGTGLYFSSIIYDISFEEEKVDEDYRKELYDLASKYGNDFVFNMLKDEDKEIIHKNNLKRVIRTLELYKNIKVSKKQYIDKEKERIENLNSKYEFILFYIDIDKNILNDRINRRVDIMFENGLEKEARYVYDLKNCTCKQSIGYKEFFDYFEGKKNIEQVREEIKLRTRQYAKRQRTWFKNMKNVITISGTNEELIELMVDYYDKKNKE